MQPKTIGITLISIGVLLFALRMDGIYREITFILLGIMGLAIWWKVQRKQGVMALSLAILALAVASLFKLPEPVRMLMLSAAFLLPWLIQGLKAQRHWPLIPAILLAVNALFSWRGPWLTIEITGAWAPLLIGLVFIAVYAFTRQLGFLIPGTILSAVGITATIPQGITNSWVFFLGLGLAFAAIWAVHTRTRGTGFGAKIWPLFPAGFFMVFCLALAFSEEVSGHLFLPILLGLPALTLLIIYAFKRHMGLLIPGLMLGSISLWFALGTEAVSPLLFFFAVSFGAILLLETRKAASPMERWWPLIPALVLAINGGMLLGSEDFYSVFSDNLGTIIIGLILIGLGILVIFGRDRKNDPGA